MTSRGRRFGEVADAYDRHRPGYPRELFVELLDRAGVGPSPRVLEVGAGTGKATVELAALAGELVAVEPDPEMARVAGDVLAAAPDVRADVRIEVATFEEAAVVGPFDLVVAAQSWHWADAATKHDRAADLLGPGGWLAVLWHVDHVRDGELAADLVALHETLPGRADIARRVLGRGPETATDAPARDIDASGRFGPVVQLTRPGTRVDDAASFAAVLETVSAYRALDAATRDDLLGRVRDTVDAHGGTVVSEGGVRLFAAPVLTPTGER